MCAPARDPGAGARSRCSSPGATTSRSSCSARSRPAPTTTSPPPAGTACCARAIAALLRRRQFEEENRLREAFGRSAAILETISDAFFAVDRLWRLVYVNHAFEDLVGTRRDAAIGVDLWERAPALQGGPFEQELRRAAEGRAPVTFEAPFPGERWFEVRAFPHEDGLSAHLRDVTERRRSQEVQAHLLGIVGHDLRTPLTSIMMSASAVSRDRELPARLRRPLERVESGAARMSRLINDLLDYSRARLGKGLPVHPVAADLHAICRDAVEAIRAAHPDRSVVYQGEGDGRGEVDPDRMLQVLLNLLTNAVRYGTPGSVVTLTCRVEPDRKIVAVHNAGGRHPPRRPPAHLRAIQAGRRRGEHLGRRRPRPLHREADS